jgi:carbamoyl-phosphate synthase large subunit
MTDPELADATYIEPITPEIVAKIIAGAPDALLPTMGGQTALNTALALRKMGVLEKYGVEMIGATPTRSTRPRTAKFRDAMAKIGLERRARATGQDAEEALRRARRWACRDHPAVLHAGRHRRRHRLQPRGIREIVERGLDASPTTKC